MPDSNKPNERAERLKLIIILFAGFPSANVKDETFEVYERILADIPLPVLTTAIEQTLAGARFPPTIAEIREIALKLVMPPKLEGAEAWGIVVKAMADIGFYRSPTFDDPIITKMVNIMGWQTLCSSENQVADRAHFIKNYDVLTAREISDAKLLPRAREMQQLATRHREIGNGG